MRRLANFFSVVLVVLSITASVTLLMFALFSYLRGNSHSLKSLYTVAIEIFENYDYECRLVCLIIAD